MFVSEVVRAHDAGHRAAKYSTRAVSDLQKAKRHLENAEEPDFVKRQKCWHGRGELPVADEHAERAYWRPKPVFGTSAKLFLAAVDNQVRQADWNVSGLELFKRDSKQPTWQDWRLWPHLALPHDQGSDQQRAVSGLLYHPRSSSIATDFQTPTTQPSGRYGKSCRRRTYTRSGC